MNRKPQTLTFEEHRILATLSSACDMPPNDFLQSVQDLLGPNYTFREAVIETFGHYFHPNRVSSSHADTGLDDSNPWFTELLCKRCSRKITSLRKPLHSSTKTQRKFTGVCANCTTPLEEAELRSATLAEFIAQNGGGQ